MSEEQVLLAFDQQATRLRRHMGASSPTEDGIKDLADL